jgi:hypothetical protein
MGQDDQDGQGQDADRVATIDDKFEALKVQDSRTERRIFWREVAIIHLTALLVAAYIVALLFKLGSLQVPRW